MKDGAVVSTIEYQEQQSLLRDAVEAAGGLPIPWAAGSSMAGVPVAEEGLAGRRFAA